MKWSSEYRPSLLGCTATGFSPDTEYALGGPGHGLQAQRLAWDSRLLGVPCARITLLGADSRPGLARLDRDLGRLLTRMDAEGIAFCDVRIALSAFPLIHMAEAHGFRLVDILALYVSRGRPAEASAPAAMRIIHREQATASQLRDILQLGKTSFRAARLYRDGHIRRQTADTFYQELLSELLGRRDAVCHLAIAQNGRAVGYVIGTQDTAPGLADPVGVLWLIGVAPSVAGRGIGSALLDSFLRRMHQHCPCVEIGTQVDNRAATTLYAKAGLLPAGHLATLHRWRP